MNTPKEGGEPKDKPLSKDEAKIEVSAAFQRMATMGANNYEPGAIKDILKKLEAGEIEPNEAVQKALEMEASKQDYH